MLERVYGRMYSREPILDNVYYGVYSGECILENVYLRMYNRECRLKSEYAGVYILKRINWRSVHWRTFNGKCIVESV